MVPLIATAILWVPNGESLAMSARKQIGVTTSYDPAYRKIGFPNGDVPKSTGVCSDVVVRAFRANGIDLQRLVHEDMRRNFRAYPQNWGLTRADPNIDHRRVPNLQTFFRRRGKEVSDRKSLPGDVVAWKLPNGRDHIGIVTRAPLVIHNIGAGAREEPILHDFRITGVYRYWH